MKKKVLAGKMERIARTFGGNDNNEKEGVFPYYGGVCIIRPGSRDVPFA